MTVQGDYRKYANKDFLGSWDIESEKVLTIKEIRYGEVTNERGTEHKLIAEWVEDFKPMILNSTNCAAIARVAGSNKVETWQGVRVSVFVQKGVRAFGKTTDALRIKDFPPRPAPTCTECGQTIQARGNYSAEQIAENTRKKYGKPICWDCAVKQRGNENG